MSDSSFSRRAFLRSSVSAFGVSTTQIQFDKNLLGQLEFLNDVPEINTSAIGVWQGPTDRNSTVISVVGAKGMKFQIKPLSEVDTQTLFEVKTFSELHEKLNIYNLFLKDLDPYLGYELSIISSRNQLIEKRIFSSLNLEKADPKIAVLSCMNYRRNEPQRQITSQLVAEKPDAIYFLGDFVYSNSRLNTILRTAATPAEAVLKYFATFLNLDFYKMKKLVPVFGIWDDHDLGQNNADSTHPYIKEFEVLFRRFFPTLTGSRSIENGPGTSFSLKAFGSQFIFLDERRFGKEGQVLGPQQISWIQSQISKSIRPLWVAASPVFWKYHFWGESLEKKAHQELNSLLHEIRASGRICTFLSGDVHYSQIQELNADVLGYRSYEITSSAFFSRSAGPLGRRSPSEGQHEYFGKPNFLILSDLQSSEKELQFQVRCISEKSTSEFMKNLTIRH